MVNKTRLLLSCTLYSILNTYDFIVLLVAIKLSEAVRICWPFCNLKWN
jgi:hypothetical protein